MFFCFIMSPHLCSSYQFVKLLDICMTFFLKKKITLLTPRSMNTLTVDLNLGTGTLFVSFWCTLKSIMDWLSSDAAALEPLLWAAAVLCLGWSLFMRSLRELKLSDCGNLRIKGFCQEEEQSEFLRWSSLRVSKSRNSLWKTVCFPLWTWFQWRRGPPVKQPPFWNAVSLSGTARPYCAAALMLYPRILLPSPQSCSSSQWRVSCSSPCLSGLPLYSRKDRHKFLCDAFSYLLRIYFAVTSSLSQPRARGFGMAACCYKGKEKISISGGKIQRQNSLRQFDSLERC